MQVLERAIRCAIAVAMLGGAVEAQAGERRQHPKKQPLISRPSIQFLGLDAWDPARDMDDRKHRVFGMASGKSGRPAGITNEKERYHYRKRSILRVEAPARLGDRPLLLRLRAPGKRKSIASFEVRF